MARFDPVDRGLGQVFVYASCHWVDHFGCVPAEYLQGFQACRALKIYAKLDPLDFELGFYTIFVQLVRCYPDLNPKAVYTVH